MLRCGSSWKAVSRSTIFELVLPGPGARTQAGSVVSWCGGVCCFVQYALRLQLSLICGGVESSTHAWTCKEYRGTDCVFIVRLYTAYAFHKQPRSSPNTKAQTQTNMS